MISIRIADIIKSVHSLNKLAVSGFSLIHSVENWNEQDGTLEIWEHDSQKVWVVLLIDANRVDLMPHRVYSTMSGDSRESVLEEYT